MPVLATCRVEEGEARGGSKSGRGEADGRVRAGSLYDSVG